VGEVSYPVETLVDAVQGNAMVGEVHEANVLKGVVYGLCDGLLI
jgi:hypothetical protein